MNDLLQLTNVAGDIFYMFTIGGLRLLIRSQGSNANVSLELYAEITNGNYRFSGHTHPPGYLIESEPRDGPFLNDFGQMRSAIWGTGSDKYDQTYSGGYLFGVDDYATDEIRRKIEREAMRKLYGIQ